MSAPPRERVVLTLLVRDEADIIGRTLDYHLDAGVDHVVVMDNASRDGTSDILAAYAEDDRVTVLYEPSDDYRQGEWASRMARLAVEAHGADWIISGDADELWVPPAGRSLHDVLADQDATILHCERRNMICAAEALGEEPRLEELVFRVRRPRPLPPLGALDQPMDAPYFAYDLPPKAVFRARGLRSIDRGAHGASYDGAPPKTAPCGIVCYHFPVRSRAELEGSIQQIGDAVARDDTLAWGVSWKYRRWLTVKQGPGGMDAVMREALPDADRLRADVSAGLIVRDPVAASLIGADGAPNAAPEEARGARRDPSGDARLSSPCTLLFVLGEDDAVRRVAWSLAGVGGVTPQSWTTGGAGTELAARYGELTRAQADLLASGDADTPLATRVLGDAFAAEFPRPHLGLIAAPGTGALFERWAAFCAEIEVRPVVILAFDGRPSKRDVAACDGGRAGASSFARAEAMLAIEEATRGAARLVVDASAPCAGADLAAMLSESCGVEWPRWLGRDPARRVDAVPDGGGGREAAFPRAASPASVGGGTLAALRTLAAFGDEAALGALTALRAAAKDARAVIGAELDALVTEARAARADAEEAALGEAAARDEAQAAVRAARADEEAEAFRTRRAREAEHRRAAARARDLLRVARARPGFYGVKAALVGAWRRRAAVARLRGSDLFDAEWYAARHPDIAAGGVDPVGHYYHYGAFEGRDPSPAFSTLAYYEAYPDVLSAGANALDHYLRAGRSEGRAVVSAAPR